MTGDQDHYESYYATKLWNLLPTIYRAEDSDQFGVNGPLREFVNRIGVQAAILRRSLDRMWEDQSIETCDDWVIPYIGDLLSTNIVSNLDPSRQRLDVAKTIYYRRRKGTLAILEELATDITGWQARCVEFFRRLGRTRHGLDPDIGTASAGEEDVATLQHAEGLVGPLTSTGIGGFADLRHVYGASRAGTAFDEFFHTADFRYGRGTVGWHGIPKLGVFLWRLLSLAVPPTTPVAVQHCENWFTFDPTGRDIPLFAAPRTAADYGANWVSPAEAQLPTPISRPLFEDISQQSLYPNALAVFPMAKPKSPTDALPLTALTVRPERGRFQVHTSPHLKHVWTTYHYGFPSTLGAGPYDRRRIGDEPFAADTLPPVSGGGAFPGGFTSGVRTIVDSLTYDSVPIQPVQVQGKLLLRSANGHRPVIRLEPTAAGWRQWTIVGLTPAASNADSSGNCLTLEGLFLSGADVVLQGEFECVTLSCCTLDPGDAAEPGISPPDAPFAIAADGRELVPSRLWISGHVATLQIDRCILASIRTREGGQVDRLTITDSILQAIPSSGFGPIQQRDVKDPPGLEQRLAGASPVAAWLRLRSPALAHVLGFSGSSPPSPGFSEPPLTSLLAAINALINGPSLYDAKAFADVRLSAATVALMKQAAGWSGPTPELNRALLEDAFPHDLADATLAFTEGEVDLARCTVLGRIAAHRLSASECLLTGLIVVDDSQHGCLRYSAWADGNFGSVGSVVPRQFECVRIAEGSAPFTTSTFGQPAYCQLLPTVDDFILPETGAPPPTPPTIAAGAEDGSEMGAFAREQTPIKERGLLIKLQEYMPAGLVPVLVYVT
jgi:hypothetical protein